MDKFYIEAGVSEIPQDGDVIRRRAARAIVMEGARVLMIQTNKGDYKFPGGGYEEELDYTPVFVDVRHAIEVNQKRIRSGEESANMWTRRETDVLLWLCARFGS